ncbi:hypothetical protein CCACVL1_25074 [Corchorus capsularis]|uniref:Uncharacterized protein n=1 Tax=Corchorus capsularis TaxID=210143 RepID=A0A1R3GM52_COCAP|nr:hypothetical protein CCACVL1_25074 [Corchorus capsularis]
MERQLQQLIRFKDNKSSDLIKEAWWRVKYFP